MGHLHVCVMLVQDDTIEHNINQSSVKRGGGGGGVLVSAHKEAMMY